MLKKIAQKTNDAVLFFIAFLTTLAMTPIAANAASYDFDTLVSKGDTIQNVNSNIENYSSSTFTMIKNVCMVIAIVLIATGLFRLKKANDPNSGVNSTQGFVLIGLGGGFAAITYLLITASTTVQGG